MPTEDAAQNRILQALDRNDKDHKEIKVALAEQRFLLLGNGGEGICEKVRNLEKERADEIENSKWRNRALWGAVITMFAKIVHDVLFV